MGYESESDLITDPLINVRIQFWTSATGPRIELIEPISQKSSVWKILSKRGGPYHYAFQVDSIISHAEEFRSMKLFPITEKIKAVAFPGLSVQFFGSPDGAVVELIGN